MSETNDDKVVHKHYHMWPGSDCSCAGLWIVTVLALTVMVLAYANALPWQ